MVSAHEGVDCGGGACPGGKQQLRDEDGEDDNHDDLHVDDCR